MLEFHTHSDLWESDEFDLSQNAFLVFTRCGNWTARHHADGLVPPDLPYRVDYTPDEFGLSPKDAIAELERVGLWTPLPDGGWRMERGPSEDLDSPMPLWRYSAPLAGGIEIAPDLTVFPDPDM